MLVAFIRVCMHVCLSFIFLCVWIDISSTPCCCFDSSWSSVRLHDVAAQIHRDLPEFPHLRCFSLLLRLLRSEWLLRRRGPGSGKWVQLPLVAAVCVAPLALSNAFLVWMCQLTRALPCGGVVLDRKKPAISQESSSKIACLPISDLPKALKVPLVLKHGSFPAEMCRWFDCLLARAQAVVKRQAAS